MTYGVNMLGGLGVTGPAGAHAVRLLTEQSGGLSGPVVQAVGGWRVLRFGGKRRAHRRIQSTWHRAHTRGRGLGEWGVVTGRGRGLG